MAEQRAKFERVKNAKKLKKSSSSWLQRHINDIYVLKAKNSGYRSRAAYKLIEINNKFHIFKKGMNVVDLGAAPGGWSQVAVELVKSSQKNNSLNSTVIAVDLLNMQEIEGVKFIEGDFTSQEVKDKILEYINLNNNSSRKIDVVMTDMAANTTGDHMTDHLRLMSLCHDVLNFANNVLSQNGSFIAKIFSGSEQNNFIKELKNSFKYVKLFKPSSSRKNSSEIYVIATNIN